MKSKLTKLISTLLILAFLVSSFAVLAFADDTEGEGEQTADSLTVVLNRNMEEGWDPTNGLSGQYKCQGFTIDSEELADFTYNHFVRCEVLAVPDSAADGFIELKDYGNITGGSILEYDIKVDCYSNTGNGYFLSPGTSQTREYVNIFTITNSEYIIQNGTHFGTNSGALNIGSLSDGWLHIANVYHFDPTLRYCDNCGVMYYSAEPAENPYDIPVNVVEDGVHCPTEGCSCNVNKYYFTIETYFSKSEVFDWKNAINANGLSKDDFDLDNNTYVLDSCRRVANTTDRAKVDKYRLGTTGVKAGGEGQGFLLDNVKLYSDPTPKDAEGKATKMTIRDDITVETHGYGTSVDANRSPNVEIQGSSNAVVDYVNTAMYMKVGSDYMLFKNEKSEIFKSRKTGAAYGAPVKVDGIVYVPFEPLLDTTGYPVFIHDDGLQYDISTAAGASILTLYRDAAIVDGERVPLTAAPFMAQDPDDPENAYPVIAIDDLSTFFPGYYVTYDEMGLIGISQGEKLFNRATDLKLMMTIMKKFVFDHLNEEELYAKVEENTNGFDHPYLIASDEQFEYLASVYAAHKAKENGEEYDEELIDDSLYNILSVLVTSAEGQYKRFSTLPEPEKAANYTFLTYAYENTPEKYQVLAFEITNPFYGIMDGKIYTDSTVYGWDYAGPADDNGDYWGKMGQHYNDGYDWAGGRNSHGVTYADRVRDMALAYRITGEERFAQMSYDIMISLCDDENWHNWSHKHHLSTGEMLMDLGLAYDWMYDKWSEIQYQRDGAYSLSHITQQIYRKGIYYSYDISRYARTSDVWTRDHNSSIRDSEGYVNNTWNWSVCDINWNCVCNSGIVMASLAIVGESSKLEDVDFTRDGKDGTDRVLWCMANNLNHISDYGLVQYCPDGSYIEGASYWGYATHYLSMIMWAVDTAAGDDLGFYEAWGLDKTYYFAIQAEASVVKGNNYWYSLWAFHDCGGGYQDTYDYFFASQMLNDPGLAAVRMDNIANGKPITWMDALGYKPEYADLTLADSQLDLDYRFEACEGVISRSSWEGGATYAGIMGGPNNFGNHGQMDSGIFTYVDDGYEWFPDMGADEYNIYEYFGYGIRQFYYRNSAEGHNQIIITSQQEAMPFGQAYAGNGKVTQYHSEDAGMYAIIDNTSAYSPFAKYANRGMLVTANRETVVIQDEISFNSAEKIAWMAHTQATSITLSDDKRTAYLSQKHIKGREEFIRVSIVSSDASLKFNVMTCGITEDAEGKLQDVLLKGIHNSKYSSENGGINEKSRQGWRRLVIQTESTLSFNCAVVIEDINSADDTTPVKYDYASMNTWAENGIYETYTGKNAVDKEETDNETIGSAKIGDIRTYAVQAQKLVESGYALTTRINDFFKHLVRVNAAVNTYRPETFQNIPQIYSAYEQYLVCIEYYRSYSNSINSEFEGVQAISKGLTGF